ncbi:hypothetical protein [Pseudomonas sp. fls2-241-TYG-175]|uniref:hypothetical protein n=1 Tax=Pseudomonas sp. fls2-241-TYG-175 TaxID=3040312 RepID=UPI0025529CAD|nr:hypothetical protein [Pseudomonas sp. fls2-241-TYG-175]
MPKEDLRAIAILLKAGLESHALATIYASIDRMAWLISASEESTSADFKKWTDQFLIVDEHFNFNSNDLWAARCGLLHTGAAESRDYRKNNANLIYYKVKEERADDVVLELIKPMLDELGVSAERVRFVDYFWLADRLIDSMSRFEDYLIAQPMISASATKKADRQISFQSLPS